MRELEAGVPQSFCQLCLFPSAVAHHDLDHTLNCSFLEPPSGLEQPSPSWSSRASFSSFDTTDEGPVYCVPHEGEGPSAWASPSPGQCSSLKYHYVRNQLVGIGDGAWGDRPG